MSSSKLSPVERDILTKLSVQELQFLSKIANDKDFETLIKITTVLVDYEKNDVFKLNDADPALGVKKAYARGRAGGYTQFGRLIVASGEEIERREKDLEERKKGSDKNA